MTYAIKSNGGASVQVRFDIYKNLIQEINFLPNLSFSPNKDSLLPHNFFLEDMITFGLVGVSFIYGILYYIMLKFKRARVNIYVLLPMLILILNSFTLHSFLGFGGISQFFICLIPFYIFNENISNSEFRNT